MASTNLLPHCSVCENAFKFGGPDPYLLPCLHSVCEKCLNRDCQSITCSRCEESFSNPNYIFLKDTVTQTEIFDSHIKNHRSELPCSNNCHMDRATVWCMKCHLFFCHVCKTSHVQEKCSHAKEIISVKDLSSGRLSSVRKTLCPEHDSCNLDIYDATCEILICSTCASTQHTQCKVREVEHASVAADKKTIEVDHENLGTKLQDAVSALDETSAKQQELKTKHADMKKVVGHGFDTLRALVTKREKELLTILENRHSSTIIKMEETYSQLEKTTQKIQLVYDYTSKLLDQSNTEDFLMLQNNVKSRIRVCLAEDVKRMDVCDVMVTFSKKKLAELKSCISDIGDVDTMEEGDTESESEVMYENIDINSASTRKWRFAPKERSRTQQIQDAQRFPVILFDIEKVNTNKIHLSNDRFLVNSKLPTERMLDRYVGTTSVTPLSDNKLSYWEVNTDVNIDEPMQKYGLLMEIGVVEGDDVDKQYCVSGQTSSRCLSIAHCATHKGVCAKVWDKGTKVRCIEDVLFNKGGEHFTLKHGILYNGEQNRVVFLDLNKMKVIAEMDGAGSQDLWPIFGVYNSTLASVKLQLVSGADVQLTDAKLSLLSPFRFW